MPEEGGKGKGVWRNATSAGRQAKRRARSKWRGDILRALKWITAADGQARRFRTVLCACTPPVASCSCGEGRAGEGGNEGASVACGCIVAFLHTSKHSLIIPPVRARPSQPRRQRTKNKKVNKRRHMRQHRKLRTRPLPSAWPSTAWAADASLLASQVSPSCAALSPALPPFPTHTYHSP